jgi:hypothetical protein
LSVTTSVRYFDGCFGGGALVCPGNAGFGCGVSASELVAAPQSIEVATSDDASVAARASERFMAVSP